MVSWKESFFARNLMLLFFYYPFAACVSLDCIFFNIVDPNATNELPVFLIVGIESPIFDNIEQIEVDFDEWVDITSKFSI